MIDLARRVCFSLILIGVLLSTPVLAHARLVWIYQDGVPVAYPFSNEVEYYKVDATEIRKANAELLGEVSGFDPEVADIGYGATKYEDGDVHYSEWYTRRRGAVYVQNVAIRDYLSPGDWRGVFGEYFDPGAAYAELDKSGPHWSFDAQAFSAFGWVYALEENDLSYNNRRRKQANVRWRRGSMDGGIWQANLNGYRVSIDDGLTQARDVKHYCGELGFRQSESNYILESYVFYGAYNSERAHLDNSYAGGTIDGQTWLAKDVVLDADLKYTSIDVQQQNETVQRADGSASLAWELGDFATLSTRAHVFNENSNLAANSHLTGYQDTGVRLELHPNQNIRIAADYRQRDLDMDRLKLEDPTAVDFIFSTNVPLAEELSSLRESASATSERYQYDARFKFDRNVIAGIQYSEEQFSDLPDIGQVITSSTAAPYFGTEHNRGDAYLQYALGNRTRLSLRGGFESKKNSLRDSEYNMHHYSLHCNTPAGRGASFLCGVSCRESDFDLPTTNADWDFDYWSYDLAITGAVGFLEDYRLSYRWQDSTGSIGGDFQGLGLEMRFKRYPLYIASWWRERDTNLPGEIGSFDDAGINITYRIDFRNLDLPSF